MNEFLLFYISQPRFKVPFELSPQQIKKRWILCSGSRLVLHGINMPYHEPELACAKDTEEGKQSTALDLDVLSIIESLETSMKT